MIGRLQSLLRCCCGHNIHIEKHIRRKHWLRRWRLYIVTCFEIMSKWLTCQCQHLISSGVFFFFFHIKYKTRYTRRFLDIYKMLLMGINYRVRHNLLFLYVRGLLSLSSSSTHMHILLLYHIELLSLLLMASM